MSARFVLPTHPRAALIGGGFIEPVHVEDRAGSASRSSACSGDDEDLSNRPNATDAKSEPSREEWKKTQ